MEHVPLLRDSGLNQKLFEEGFVTLPFLNTGEVSALTALFYEYHSEQEVNGLYVSATNRGFEVVQELSERINNVFARAIEQHIENGIALGGTFITKPANESEPLHPHQDWNIVDESRFRSFTIWVPLTDVNDDNGCMYVLPRSHDLIRGYRHVTIPNVYGHIYDQVWRSMLPVHLKAGEAIIFDHALGHASKPNRSDRIRIAATHSLLSPNAEMRFYWNNNGVVEEYEGENYFYITEEAKAGPGKLKKIRNLDYRMTQLNEIEFRNVYQARVNIWSWQWIGSIMKQSLRMKNAFSMLGAI